MAFGKLITFVPGQTVPSVVPWKKDEKEGEEGEEEEPPLKLLHQTLNGWIDAINVTYEGKLRSGYFNADGELKQMLYNQRASEICCIRILGPFAISIPDE
jgi:hypothetical protein